MKTVRYDGRPGDTLVAFGHELAGGDTAEMTNEQAAQLDADPQVAVTVLDEHAHEDDQPSEHQPEADDGEGHDDTEPEED